MAGEISFLELGVDDVERARVFYGALLGWRFETGPELQGLSIVGPGVAAGIHGGDPGAHAYLFYRVDDIEAAVSRVRELGGSIVDMSVEGDDAQIARFGRFRLCKDDQGSPFGLHQPPRQ